MSCGRCNTGIEGFADHKYAPGTMGTCLKASQWAQPLGRSPSCKLHIECMSAVLHRARRQHIVHLSQVQRSASIMISCSVHCFVECPFLWYKACHVPGQCTICNTSILFGISFRVSSAWCWNFPSMMDSPCGCRKRRYKHAGHCETSPPLVVISPCNAGPARESCGAVCSG
jgi:hypothetical protein